MKQLILGNEANCGSPPRAADKARQQDRQVHGAQGAADLRDLPCEEGEHQTQRQTDSGIGQVANVHFVLRNNIHRDLFLSNMLPS